MTPVDTAGAGEFAAEIISHYGARPETPLCDLIAEKIKP